MNAIEKIIKDLEVEAGMLFNTSEALMKKATALRRELEASGTKSISPSKEDEEYAKKRDKVLYKRKKALIRASQKVNNNK